MKFSPPNFSTAAIVLALAVVPLMSGVASSGNPSARGQLAPSLVSAPVVSGVAQEGLWLSTDGGSWSGPGVKLALQWLRCDSLGGGCVAIAGATSSTFLLAAVDVGSTLRVRVMASNKNGETSAVSEPSGVVAPAPLAAPATVVAPSSNSSPEITGTAQEGQTLRASSGSWSGTEPLSYRYQWQRCDTAGKGCAAVNGATADSYALTANDVGATMRVAVTASNTAGSATATSAATAVVASLTTTTSTSSSGTSSVCSTSALSACPASYFSGPLGKNNLLPPREGAFLILFPSSIGETWQQRQTRILQRMADTGRSFDSIHIHYWGGGTYAGQSNCSSPEAIQNNWLGWAKSHAPLATVTWSPDRSLANINSGGADACIDAVADHFKSFNFPVMLRLFHEHNLPWPHYAGTGQPFIDAWRRVVDRFKARGATNVGFWWAPWEFAGDPHRTATNNSYPGDAYVDWAGSGTYNFCLVGDSNCWSTPDHAGWAEFDKLVNYSYNAGDPAGSLHGRWGPRKPFVVAETNTVYDAHHPARKGDWYRAIPAGAKTIPYLRGISIYDSDMTAVGHPNFRVDYPASNPDVYNGFKQMAADPWLNTH